MEQLHDKLKAWIINPDRDHSEGITLLSRLNRNKRLAQSLGKNETRYKREKLLYELQKLYKALPSITTPTEIDDTDSAAGKSQTVDEMKEEMDIPPVGPAGGQSELTGDGTGETSPLITPPATIRTDEPLLIISAQDAIIAEDLEIVYTKMFNKKGILTNSLRDFNEEDNEGRKAVLDQIAGISSDMQEVKSKVDYFKLHGKLPELVSPPPAGDTLAEKAIPDDPILMQKLLLNERSNISKIKNKLKEGQVNPDKLKDLEDILQKKTELVNEIQRRLNGNGS